MEGGSRSGNLARLGRPSALLTALLTAYCLLCYLLQSLKVVELARGVSALE